MEPCPLLKRSYAHSVHIENTNRQFVREEYPRGGAEDHGGACMQRTSESIGLRGGGNSGLEAGLDLVNFLFLEKSGIGGRMKT